jgi:hypothetical protein
MSSPVKVVQAEPFPMAQINSAVAVTKAGGALGIDVSTKYAATIYWDFAPLATTANCSPTNLSIQSSQKATGDDTWVPLQEWASATVTPLTGTLTGIVGSGFTSAANFGQNVFVLLVGAPLNTSEIHYITSVAGGGPYTYTTEDTPSAGLAAAAVYTYAQRFKMDLDLSATSRLRFCIYNARGTTTRNVLCRLALTTLDSIT